MLMPAPSSLASGILSDQICQNSRTLLSFSARKGIEPFAMASCCRGDFPDTGGLGVFTPEAGVTPVLFPLQV